jgi:S1-C subfamily serine protease
MNKINIITISAVITILFSFFSTAIIGASEVSTNSSSEPAESLNSKYNVDELKTLARKITVKIYSGNTSGSGIIIKKENDSYLVVTNDHVLSRGKNDYRIQTEDNEIYSAIIVPNPKFNNYDLALLKFTSKKEYQVATLGNSNNLQKGDLVIASGFPFTADPKIDNGFNFTQGFVTLIPDKSLEDGYQIGYTNLIQKGMSGGPVLNQKGEVVAINGMHAYPLWGEPYIYQDGDQPSPEDKEIMTRSSWAIPINTLSRLTIDVD